MQPTPYVVPPGPSARLLGIVCLLCACRPTATSAPARATTAADATPATPPEVAAAEVPPAPEPPEDFDLEAIDRYLSQAVTVDGHVGMSVAIMRDGELVLANGYGKRSLDPEAPTTPQTPFAIASISKQFVCAAALGLAERKKLSMNDKVARYYPDLTRAKEITLLDALNHVSGYTDYYPLDFTTVEQTQPIEPDALIARYGSQPLDFEPRTRFSYSNTGYAIVGRVIERRSGKPLNTVINNRIVAPLKLEHTYFREDTLRPDAAVGYGSFALSDPKPVPAEGAGWLHGAGALWSTASDLLRWDLALHTGKVLSPRSYAVMTTPATLADGRDTGYGCGLSVERRKGETLFGHGGAVNGYLSYNAFIPRTRSGVAVLVNSLAADPRAIANVVLDLIVADGVATRPVPEVTGPPVDDVARQIVAAMQRGTLPRELFTDDFNAFATDAAVASTAKPLAALGEPTAVVVLRTAERGGMEVSVLELVFGSVTLRAIVFRRPDGRIAEFLLKP